MNNVFAGLILGFWMIFVIFLGWDKKVPAIWNLIDGILITLMFGVVYWVPFWLIFLK